MHADCIVFYDSIVLVLSSWYTAKILVAMFANVYRCPRTGSTTIGYPLKTTLDGTVGEVHRSPEVVAAAPSSSSSDGFRTTFIRQRFRRRFEFLSEKSRASHITTAVRGEQRGRGRCRRR